MSTIVSFARPRPQAATLHYGESFVARHILPDMCHGAPTVRLDAKGMYPLCLMTRWARVCQGAVSRSKRKGEINACPSVGSIYPKSKDFRNEFCFQPTAQFFVNT